MATIADAQPWPPRASPENVVDTDLGGSDREMEAGLLLMGIATPELRATVADDDMDMDVDGPSAMRDDAATESDATEEDDDPGADRPPATIHTIRLRPPGPSFEGGLTAYGSRGDLPPPADPRHQAAISAMRTSAVPVPSRSRRSSQPPVFNIPGQAPLLFQSAPTGLGFYGNGNGNGQYQAGANGNGQGQTSQTAAFGTSISSVASVESIRELEMSIFGTEIDATAAQRFNGGSTGSFMLGPWEGEGLEDAMSDAETEEEDPDFSDDEDGSGDENDGMDEGLMDSGVVVGSAGGAMRVRKSPMMMASSADPTRRYICPHPGCGKVYKNPGGLKYHLAHGHSVFKPYKCCVEDCGKRYRNAGGLKYHLEHTHYEVFASMRKVTAAGKTKVDLSSCYDPGTQPQSLPPKNTKSPRMRSNSQSWGSPPAFPPGTSMPVFGTKSRSAALSPPSALFASTTLNSLPKQGLFPSIARSYN